MSIKLIISAVTFFALSNTDALNLRSVITNVNYLNNSVSSIDSLSNIPINCTNTNYLSPECGYKGICLPNGACKCDENYATFPRNHPVQCNYEKKKTSTMFWLSLLVGHISGAGYWYVGYEDMAIAQIIISFFALIAYVFFSSFRSLRGKMKEKNIPSELKTPLIVWGCCGCIFGIIAISLWVTSIISTLLYKYTDENDVVLSDW